MTIQITPRFVLASNIELNVHKMKTTKKGTVEAVPLNDLQF